MGENMQMGPGMGQGMGPMMGGMQGGPGMGMMGEMMGGHEDPMLTALMDINRIISEGLLPNVCSVVGESCFNNLKTAVKRGSKTYTKLVKDLTVLENSEEISSMQMVVNFLRMIPNFTTLNKLLTAADAADAGDMEDALSNLESVLSSAKGALRPMLKGVGSGL